MNKIILKEHITNSNLSEEAKKEIFQIIDDSDNNLEILFEKLLKYLGVAIKLIDLL